MTWILTYVLAVVEKFIGDVDTERQLKKIQFYQLSLIHFRLLIGPQNPEMTAKVTKKRCNAVKAGSKYVRVHTFNAKDSNTVVTNYYQVIHFAPVIF